MIAPRLPDFPVPPGHTEASWLRELVARKAPGRYGPAGAERVPGAHAQIARELEVIERLEFPGYFLIVHDIVAFCDDNDILCQGRGSAANSAVCFALGITSVDPVSHHLLFERFLSEGRDGPPDIDLDIEHRRREEVIQYVYRTYGRDRAAQVANVISYRPRMALRDAGRALGFTPADADAWAREIGPGPAAEGEALPGGAPAAVKELAARMQRLPRHLGIHSGGMVICDRPVGEVCPVEWARMPGRTVLQWDKDDCAYAGLVKIDLLGLGMLAALHDCFNLVTKHHGEHWTMSSIPQEDPAVYQMLAEADTVGVFQVESRAQMATLPRLRPQQFYDLVIEVALIRPGPIQGGSVHPYLRRHDGLEDAAMPHESMRPALGKTLGVPLFQEQMMQLAIDCAGFTPDEADRLRQAMSAKRAPERIEELRQRLLDGMAERGIGPGRRRGHLRQDPGLLQLRVPRVARDQLRLPGLRQRVAEAVLPGRVHRRAAAQPADGVLRPAQPDQRRAPARGHRARRGRERQRRAGHAGGLRPCWPDRAGHQARPVRRAQPGHPGGRTGRGRAAPTGTWRTSPPGRACRPRRSRRWPPRARSAASGSAGAPRCGRPGPPPRCARGSCPAPPPG